MHHHIEQTIKVNVPAGKIWQVMEDFSSVERFATTIKTSPIINDIESGLGAKRLCTFKDGTSLVEEIVEYQQGESFKMELSEHSLPLKSMQAKMQVKRIDDDSSELYMSSQFVVKAGPLGWLLGKLIMGPMMKGVFKKVMSGLAYHAHTGERVGEELPSSQRLSEILIH